eukprot:TRINITY_DN400_c0_g1_i1.p1 TRINITY_DN400_c0_g1~~TRINITY_DN400_c0_g1_i1.p1  ORF type:complete len:176 (-),score=48.64 TRINITY_DN400_c0_g1_i1:70-597(-)
MSGETDNYISEILEDLNENKSKKTTVDTQEVEDAEAELKKMQQKLLEIEEESRMLKQMTNHYESVTNAHLDKPEIDSRSVFVGNVDFSTSADELESHFEACGSMVRVNIMVDKWTGKPKGYAYIEFKNKESVANAVELNESNFKGRVLKVMPKRTNKPGMGRRRRRRRRRRRSYY